jgi:hypothetical protein
MKVVTEVDVSNPALAIIKKQFLKENNNPLG